MPFTLSQFKRALRTQLEARTPALDGVTIFDYVPGASTDTNEHIILGSEPTSGLQEWAAIGQSRRDDRHTVPCEIAAWRAGAGRDPAIAAEDRADAIFDEVVAQLTDWPTGVGDQITALTISAVGTDNGPAERGSMAGRIFVITFDLTYTARFS